MSAPLDEAIPNSRVVASGSADAITVEGGSDGRHVFGMNEPRRTFPPRPKPTLPVVDLSRYVVWFVEPPGIMADHEVLELLDGRLV